MSSSPVNAAAPASSEAEGSRTFEVTPPRLVQQVELVYPPEALEAQLHGDVSVLLVVDARGNVLRVELEEGDPVFEQAALDAAKRLVFEPAHRDGQPIQVSTRVFFHFAPPADFGDTPGLEIVVHGDHPDRSDSRARTTLDEEALEQNVGEDLASTVTDVAGVRMAGGGTDAAKPIIRGHHERRLLMLNDGVRHESQKWGPDHAPEIDPFSAGSISVIRGAAGTRYGPDAIGGVILVEPPPLRREAGSSGKLLTSFNTNGLRPYGAFRVDSGSDRGVSTRLEGNLAVGASPSTPDYVLGNTGSRIWNLGGVVAQEWDGGRVMASWHHYDFLAGIYYGVVNSTPDEFLGQLDRDRPISADLWETTYEIDRPYQDVTHDVGVIKTELAGDWGTFEATYAFQINLRQEFEQVRDDITGPQFDFTLRTHSIDSFYQHPSFSMKQGDLQGGIGLQGSFQENVYRGLPLIPNFRGFSGGVFAYERLSLERFDVEIGTRVDGLSRAAYLRDGDYENHVRRETLDESSCTAVSDGQRYRCPADYLAGSVSLGGLAHLVPEHWDLKLDLSTATRFPNVDELYLLGHAPTFPVYANGFPDLGTETVWNGSLTSGLRVAWLEAEVSGYAQFIEDYIYFSPVLNDSGNPKVETTIRGAYPGWDFRPIDAQFLGVDGSLDLGPEAPLGLRALGGLVRGVDTATSHQLVGTPADYLKLSVIGRAPSLGSVERLQAEVCVEWVASQSLVDPALDFAPPPPGYTLLGAGVSAEVGRKNPIRIGVDAHNLLNARYRDYSSLIRYYADQPGRDIRFRAGMDF